LKIFSAALVICLILIVIFPGSCSRQPETVDLGAFIGLSGSISAYGISQKNGLDLAVNDVNTGHYLGENRQLEVIFVDTGDTVEGAVAAINKLINENNVIGIIGPTLSAQAFAADPLAQTAKKPVIGISNTVPDFTTMGDYIFRCSLPESQVVSNTIETAALKYGLRNVGILWGNDDPFTKSTHQAFLDAASKNNLNIMADRTFIKGESDFNTRLSEIISVHPDAILVSAFIQEAAPIVKQVRSLGFTGLIIGGNGFNSSDLIKQAGESAEGVIVGTAWNLNSPGLKNSDFIAAYKKAYGKEPDQFAAQSYTSIRLFAEAIRSAGTNEPQSVRNALLQIRNFDSPLGNFSFTQNREPLHESIVQIVHNGQFEILK
jgi:branched-chain amino acid transport system substrate-binding protein